MLRHVLVFALTNITIAAPSSPWQAIVQWDNDLLAGSDSNYTNGIRLSLLQELAPDTESDHFLRRLLLPLTGAGQTSSFGQWRLPGEETLRFAWGFGITQLMFTPDDPTAQTAPPGERPYAGWLGGELFVHAKTEQSVSSVTIALGTTGENSLAEETQDWVHEKRNAPIFQGWDSQVPNAITANLYLDHKHAFPNALTASAGPLGFDGYFEFGTALGNFRTDAYLGALTRLGLNLPASYSTPRIQIGSHANTLFRSAGREDPRFSAYAFLGVRGSLVLHDITLDGPLLSDFDTGVDRVPLVGEMIVGGALRYQLVELALSQTLRSNEFDGQSTRQEYVSVMVRFQLPF